MAAKKNKKTSIKKNFLYRAFFDVLSMITPLITAPYVSRVLGADGIGIYSYTSSLMTFFTIFGALGTASYGMREIARHRDDRKESSRLFWEIEIMTVITSLSCTLLWVVLCILYSDYTPYLFALIPMLFGTMFDISWYFTGYEKLSYTVINNSIVKILSVVCIFVFVHNKNDLLLYVLLSSLATCLGNLSMWVHLPGMLVKTELKHLNFKKHFKETLIYFIPTIATSIYTILDKTLIGIITNDNYQNGYYDQAYKIIRIIKSVVFTAVNTVMGARLSYLFAKEKYDEIKKDINKSMSFILFLAFGATFMLVGISKNFVPVFFGDGYDPVIFMMCLMSPLIIIIGISNCLGSQYYTPSGRRKESAKIIVIGSVINLCLNLCAIPFFGASGAILASLIAEGFISVLYIIKSKGYMSFATLLKLSWKRIIAGALSCAAVFFTGLFFTSSNVTDGSKLSRLISSGLGLGVQMIVGVIVYSVILALFRDEILFELFATAKNSFRKIFKRKAG